MQINMHQQKSNQHHIGLVASAILIGVVIMVGVMVFYVMARHTERLLSTSLQSALQNHVELISSEIEGGVDMIDALTNRPLMVEQLEIVNARKNDPVALARLKDVIVPAILKTGISGVILYDKTGAEVIRGGVFVQPDLSIPLQLPGQLRLAWKNNYVLQGKVSVRKGGEIVGSLMAEKALHGIAPMFTSVRNSGRTRELALCAPSGSLNMTCFPLTLTPKVLHVAKRNSKGVALPMTHALEGRKGVIKAHDYRQQKVVAAYSPVGDLGLGMVLKMDRDEFYEPVWDQLRFLLPLMAALLGVALLLLRWQLTPLIAKLVISERKAREALTELQNSENRVQAVLDNVEEGIITLTDIGIIELFNPGAERMFGYRSHEMIGKSMSVLMTEPYRSQHDEYLGRYLQTGQDTMIGVLREVNGVRSDGSVFPMEMRVSEFYIGGYRRFIGTLRDITERKAIEAKIIHLAHFDALTNLPNRRLVQDRIQQAIVSAQRTGSEFAVLFIDLDKFKDINDTLGHDVGDKLLEIVALRLTESLRAQDTVGRQGGDEFIVLLASLSTAEDAARVAQKILEALAVPFEINGQSLQSGTSIGIATYPHDGLTVETLLKNSDTAMYSAKAAGRNNYQFFAEEMNKASTERLLLERNLRLAIERNELLLHYQPLVDIASGRIVATEALVRWDHPQLGRVGPERFIPVAEETGLIVPLGEWVLRHACMQLVQWREQGIHPPRMVVNLSPRQFRQKHLLRNFYRVLSETGVDPHWLGLEITESVIMDNPEISIAVLEALRKLGFELSLDDFGTGYSSLSYLKRLPIDKLKIDRSFVNYITSDVDDEAMVGAIIVMAHQLDIDVVAEGVETAEQLEFLRDHNCDEFQGYLFSRPQPPENLTALLKASSHKSATQ